jgi:hypothetical protein
VAALLSAALTACGIGGSGAGPTKRFEPEGFGITFEYPFALAEKTLRGNGSSGDSDDVVREVTLTDDDFIAVRRDPMQASELASGINTLEPEVDQLAKVLDPNVGTPRPITIGGMPGLEYQDADPGVEQRFLFFLGPEVLYLVHCRSTEQHRAEISAACDTVQRTLHTA